MKLKKLLAISMSAVLAMTALTACGSKDDSSEAGSGSASSKKTAKVIEIDLTDEQYAFGVDKEQPELLTQVNDFIKSIMQRITGQGIVFLEIDGSVVDYMLAPGQQMVIDTGYLAMMDATCSLNAETVKGGAMNMFFGGEGFFNTVVTGPGRITLQTMPKSQLAAEIASMIPSK